MIKIILISLVVNLCTVYGQNVQVRQDGSIDTLIIDDTEVLSAGKDTLEFDKFKYNGKDYVVIQLAEVSKSQTGDCINKYILLYDIAWKRLVAKFCKESILRYYDNYSKNMSKTWIFDLSKMTIIIDGNIVDIDLNRNDIFEPKQSLYSGDNLISPAESLNFAFNYIPKVNSNILEITVKNPGRIPFVNLILFAKDGDSVDGEIVGELITRPDGMSEDEFVDDNVILRPKGLDASLEKDSRGRYYILISFEEYVVSDELRISIPVFLRPGMYNYFYILAREYMQGSDPLPIKGVFSVKSQNESKLKTKSTKKVVSTVKSKIEKKSDIKVGERASIK